MNKILLSPNTQISVLTCGEGKALYSVFGHTAIRINNLDTGDDWVYNYGTFDFSIPNFYLKFVKGDLKYHLSKTTYNDFVFTYQYFNRSVYEQVLNLTTEQKQKIFDLIENQINSEAKYYEYRFIDDNCTTKVVDLINAAIEPNLPVEFKENQGTYRGMINDYLSNNYVEQLGINLIFGTKTDGKVEHIFLPDKLQKSIDIAKNGEMPLLEKNITVYEAKEQDTSLYNSFFPFLLLSIFIGFLSKKQWFRTGWLFTMAILGLFFIWVGTYSNHTEVHNNTVLLICNPLYIAYFFIINRKIKKTFLILFQVIFLLFILAKLGDLLAYFPVFIITAFVFYNEMKGLRNKKTFFKQ